MPSQPPTSCTDLCFLWVNEPCTNKVAELLAPLRPYEKRVFMDTRLQKCNYQNQLTSDQHTRSAFFDICKPIGLSTNASHHGIGFVLQQQGQSGEWTPDLTFWVMLVRIYRITAVSKSIEVLKCKMILAGISNFTIVLDQSVTAWTKSRILVGNIYLKG